MLASSQHCGVGLALYFIAMQTNIIQRDIGLLRAIERELKP